MGAVERLAQRPVAEVRVDLGGRDRGVAEQLLHDPQVGALLEQVRGERVAQHVRRDGLLDAHRGRVVAHEAEDALARDAAAARVQQERRRLLALAEVRPPAREVAASGLGRETARRHDALTPALALDAHDAALEIEIAGAQAGSSETRRPPP